MTPIFTNIIVLANKYDLFETQEMFIKTIFILSYIIN